MSQEEEPSAQERVGTLAAELMEWLDEHHPDGELALVAITVAVHAPDDEDDVDIYVHSLSEGTRLDHVGLLRLAIPVLERPG